MRLRPLRWWDIAALVPLELELFPRDAWPAEAFWAELSLGAARAYLLAEDEAGALLGYAGLSCPVDARGGDAEVMTVAVAPAAQGGGVGRALVDALQDLAIARGAGRLLLEVRADNAAARRLYAATGFEQISVRPGYYRSTGPDQPADATDALVLARSLAGVPARSGAADSVRS